MGAVTEASKGEENTTKEKNVQRIIIDCSGQTICVQVKLGLFENG